MGKSLLCSTPVSLFPNTLKLKLTKRKLKKFKKSQRDACEVIIYLSEKIIKVPRKK